MKGETDKEWRSRIQYSSPSQILGSAPIKLLELQESISRLGVNYYSIELHKYLSK